jgi:hypothetical protein
MPLRLAGRAFQAWSGVTPEITPELRAIIMAPLNAQAMAKRLLDRTNAIYRIFPPFKA